MNFQDEFQERDGQTGLWQGAAITSATTRRVGTCSVQYANVVVTQESEGTDVTIAIPLDSTRLETKHWSAAAGRSEVCATVPAHCTSSQQDEGPASHPLSNPIKCS